jgi:hypothetical protein
MRHGNEQSRATQNIPANYAEGHLIRFEDLMLNFWVFLISGDCQGCIFTRNSLGIQTRTTKSSILNSGMTSLATYVYYSDTQELQLTKFGTDSITPAETDPVLDFLDSRR